MFENEYDIHSLQKVIPTGQNFEMLITPRYLEHYVNHVYEPLTTRIISTILRKGGIFVDIGAHYGFYTLLAGNNSQVSRILAFEPAPVNHQILKQNVELNHLKNVELFNLAVSDSNDTRQFKIVEASDSCGFYDHPNLTTIEEIEVNTVTLDSIFTEMEDVEFFVKIDAEGHEINILDGMEKLIKNSLPKLRLIVEYNPQLLENAKQKPGELVSRLFALGFQVFIIDEKSGILKKIGSEHVSHNYEELSELKQSSDFVNLLCVPSLQSLNVVFFSHSAEMYGAERCLLTYVTDIIQQGAECTVFLPSPGILKENLEKIGAITQIFPYGRWSDTNKIGTQVHKEQFNHNIGMIWNEILPTLRRINPDVIVTNTSVIPWGAICAFILNKPHVWYIQEFGGADHELRYFYPQQIISKYIEGSSNVVITNSNAIKKHFFGKTKKENIKTIYLPVDFDLVKILSSENCPYFNDENSFKLALIGTIQAGKGQIDAIDAVNELVSGGKKVELILAGGIDPEYYESLRNLIQQYNLQPFVRITNFLENPYPLFRQADLVLVCSRNEAFGLVTLEAMSLGKPVIGTNSGGTPEIIQDGDTGLLYTPGDYKELANKITELMENQEERKKIGLNAAQHVYKNFSKDVSITKFLNILLLQKLSPSYSSLEFIYWVIGLIKEYLLDLSVKTQNQFLRLEQEKTSLKTELAEKDTQASGLQEQLAENVTQASSLQEQLADKDNQVATLQNQLGEKDEQVSTLKELLTQTNNENTSLNKQLAEKGNQITSYSKQLSRVEQYSKKLQTQITNLEEQVEDFTKRFVAAEKQNLILSTQKNSLQQEVTSIKDHLNQRENILQGLNSTLLEIYSSTAWKIIKYMWRVRLWLAPKGSRREKLGQAISNVFHKKDAGIIHLENSSIDGSLPLANIIQDDSLNLNTYSLTIEEGNEDKPLVSVIIPCYNDGIYLNECLQSVYNQTYKHLEVIIINDGSTDIDTNYILKNISLPLTRVINIDHSGPAAARNAGIKIANGEYILPLDADDKIHSSYIEKAIAILEEQENTGIVYCQAEYFGSETGLWVLPPYSIDVMLLDNVIFATSLYRKTDWQNVKGYDESLKHGMEDYDFWLSLIEMGREVIQIPEVLFYYRIREDSRTNKFNEKLEQVQDTYLRIYRNHPGLFSKYQSEYSIRLRNALIELVFIKRELEASRGN